MSEQTTAPTERDKMIRTLITDLDAARAGGIVYTYGLIQQRLRAILDAS